MLNFVRTVGSSPATTTLNVRSGEFGICPPEIESIAQYKPAPPPPPPPKPCPMPKIVLSEEIPEKQRAAAIEAFRKVWDAGKCVACNDVKAVKLDQMVPSGIRATFYRSYGDDVALRGGGLGYIFDQAEINRTLPPGGTYLKEYGKPYTDENWQLDGRLGAIPTDEELARDRCYTPVHSGWAYLTTKPRTTMGLGQATPADVKEELSTLDALKRYQRLALIVSVCSLFAMGTLAGVNLYRAWRDYR